MTSAPTTTAATRRTSPSVPALSALIVGSRRRPCGGTRCILCGFTMKRMIQINRHSLPDQAFNIPEKIALLGTAKRYGIT